MYENFFTITPYFFYNNSIQWTAWTFALDTSTSTELMSGDKSRKWVHQKINQPTNRYWAIMEQLT